jgi:fermentation-respiration switch protein FrsA (DUF1100 family)
LNTKRGDAVKLAAREKRGCRYWLKLLSVGLVGGLVMLYAGYIVLWVNAMVRSAQRSVCCITPADEGLDYEAVTFTSYDGVTLSGWYIPPQNGAAVILLHGYGAHRVEMLGRAGMLAKHGYGALLYDLRAHGESGGHMRSLGWADTNDVLAALAFLQQREEVDPGRVGILGFSVGGQVALRAAAQADEIAAVVAEEPGLARCQDIPELVSLDERLTALSYWLGFKGIAWRTGVPPPSAVVAVIGDIAPRPILLIATGQDVGLRLVKHYYARAGEPKTLWEIPETGHGIGSVAHPVEYEERVVSFFNQALLADRHSD